MTAGARHRPQSRMLGPPAFEVATMRGWRDPQASMLGFIDPEERIPLDHPLRTIKCLADRALAELSANLDALYAEGGLAGCDPAVLTTYNVCPDMEAAAKRDSDSPVAARAAE